MDRDKKASLLKSRTMGPTGSKNKPLFNSADLIMLGPKQDKQGAKNLPVPSHDRKPSGSPGPAKKPKLAPGPPSTAGPPRFPSVVKRDIMGVRRDTWESKIIHVEPETLMTLFTMAEKENDEERMQGILCGAVKLLRMQKPKPDAVLYLSLMFLAKTRPAIFQSEVVLEAFCHLLKKETPPLPTIKGKSANAVSILAANLLLAVFQDVENWPEIFVRVYVDDSLGDRLWVDHEECRCFVENILTAFRTRMPPKSMMAPELTFKSEACASPPASSTASLDDDDSLSSLHLDLKETSTSMSVIPRYSTQEKNIEKYIIEVIQEHLQRRQPTDISRNVLKLMVCTCGVSAVRALVAHRLETWLTNPKLTRPAQDLLLTTCMNCNEHNKSDQDVIEYLVRIRVKTKPVINHFLQCIKELLSLHAENLPTMLRKTIYNELSQSRNPNNMSLISVILQHSPDRAARVLAEIFQDLLANREDYLRALRALFREIIRSLRHELDFHSFCLGLMTERKDLQIANFELPLKERLMSQVADLITLATFMAITPAVKDCATALYRGEKRDLTPLFHFHRQISAIQCDVVTWLHESVIKIYRPSHDEYMNLLRKSLFLCDQFDQYSRSADNWPPEQERALYMRIASEVPVMEDTLLRMLFVGMSKDHPPTAAETIDLFDQLIRRAGVVYRDDGPAVLHVERLEIFDIIFSLCAYRRPEMYTLPEGYTPPTVAVADMYWRAMIIMIIVIAHNPSTCGRKAWTEYPILRTMMYMCITNSFVFPTAVTAEQGEEMKATEAQIALQEKHSILEYEMHLAANTTNKQVVAITEQNSLLLPRLISMNPTGPVRRPPQGVLDQLRALNEKLHLGHLLCRSRNPDYLLEIIRDQQQGSSQSMPWLADLVESSEGSLDILPVQCLCEFLLGDALEMGNEANRQRMPPNKRRKLQQLMAHLQRILRDADSDQNAAREVIEYFMKRLTSHHMGPRGLAVRALQLLLCPPTPTGDDGDYDWLLEQIPQLPHFIYLLDQVICTLREAVHIETDPFAIVAYVKFLSLFTPDEQKADVCLDLAHLMVERATIMNTILPQDNTSFVYGELFLSSLFDIFLGYLDIARRTQFIEWIDEYIQIEWSSGEQAHMHCLVVHSMIITLTYGVPRQNPQRFDRLLNAWFPSNGDTVHAYLSPSREEALLLPDWLKLRMIRSPIEQLVDAALKDLQSDQLVLFIQSFGIPVASMSKLLQRLDGAVEVDPQSVTNAIVDRAYMYQLVEVQHIRGAIGGDRYKQLLAVDLETPMESESVAHPSVIQIAPRRNWTTSQPEAEFHSVGRAVVQIFRLEPDRATINSKEEQDLYRKLQKLFAEDIGRSNLSGSSVEEFIMTCKSILRVPQEAELFVTQLQSKAASSCSLFKLTITACQKEPQTSPLIRELTAVCSRIVDMINVSNTSTALLQMLTQFLNRRTSPGQRDLDVQIGKNQDLADSLSHVAVEQPDRLEEALCALVQRAIRSRDSAELCKAVTRILSDESLAERSRINTTFILVDWFERSEPECVWTDKAAQLRLLFEKTNGRVSQTSRFRLYLLSVLIHRAHWTTLLHCISQLLVRPLDPRFDASAVLDFLSACMFIPKIWQGRDKKLPKHHVIENVLALSTDEICSVADYIIEEMIDAKEEEHSKNVVTSRMHIVEHSCVKQAHITFLADHLVTIVSDNGPRSNAAKTLLVKLYLCMPSIIFSADSVNYLLSDISPQKNGHTRVDSLSHSILIALSVCDTDKNFKSDLRYLNLSCRKLAATHPDLFLRQLPLIASLLHSRMSLGIPMFGQKNNRKSFFTCMLGIMELLSNKLYHQEYTSVVNSIFGVYLESLLLHVNAGMTRAVEDNIGGNLNHLLGLVQSYVKHNPDAAREFLAAHQENLEELSATYKHMNSLRILLKGGVFLQDDKATASLVEMPEEIQKFPFNLSDRDATMKALQKLEITASRKPSILELYQNELQSLLSTGDSQLCKHSFKLVLMCIEQCPGSAGRFVSCYLQCLASERRDVVSMALEKLPEFVVLCEEYAPLLLQKAFQLGVSSNVNSVEPISDALEVLHMQYGN
ncbi:integrator complex subunit 1 [Galendromus occidentalis]|uniref:Integrator complex subunit 1 n=1 Tax=Galendromus occidentalis TaxID=34638 RepID=A0AAJ6QXC9_9ACAR|nr:integrator complex subunit 1 [Galendromus occidentalis]